MSSLSRTPAVLFFNDSRGLSLSLDHPLTMKPYQEQFPIGSTVRIAELAELERFRREWRYHHKLEAEQLGFAGRTARVAKAAFYHGGDVLYTLDGVPGIWDEACVSCC